MVGSNGCLKEQSLATDLDGIMACQDWGLQVARSPQTAIGFVTVEEYCYASSGNLHRLPELALQYSSTVTEMSEHHTNSSAETSLPELEMQ